MNVSKFPYPIPKPILLQKLRNFLGEDIGYGDITSGIIPYAEEGKAKIFAKSSGIVAGIEEARHLFSDNGINVDSKCEDGDKIEKGVIIMELEGNLRHILMVERTALNFLMKLSSIATSTADFVKVVRKQGLKTIIAATRKTTPGFSYFEKKAVYLGGGDPHRWNLSDMVLLKDTHLKFYNRNIKQLMDKAHQQVSFSKKIELEIENPLDVPLAISQGVDIIMLDNMTPQEITTVIATVKPSSNIIFEASGNITKENILEYAKSGVDIISSSAIIFHPHKHVDFSLRLKD